MNALSLAGSAFSVCGLVDVLIRAGIETTRLYGNARSSFRDIENILKTLRNLAEILILIRNSITEFEQSPYATEDQRQLPPQLQNVLLECGHILQELRRIAEGSLRKVDQGWFIQRFKDVQRATRHERVQKHCVKIEQHKTTLILLLSLIGGRNEIANRVQMQATRQDIAQASRETRREGVHTRRDLMRTETEIRSNIEHARGDISESRQDLARVITQSGAAIQEDIAQTSRRVLSVVDNALQHTNDSVAQLHTSIKTLGGLFESLKTDNARLNFIFEGSNIAALAEPLTLMKSDIQNAVQTAADFNTCEQLVMTESDVRWLQAEIRNMLASSYEIAAEHERSGGSISPPQWIEGNAGFHPKTRKSCLEPSKSLTPARHIRTKFATKRKDSSSYKRIKIQTLKGIVELKWHVSTESDFSATSLLVDISIQPNIELSSTLIQVHLMKEYRPDFLTPKIERMISVWIMRHDLLDRELVACLKTDDLDDFRRLLSNGHVSVYHREPCFTLIEYAASFYSSNILGYLSKLEIGLYDEVFDLSSIFGDGIQQAVWILFDRVLEVDKIKPDLDEDAENQLIDAICKTWDILYNRNSEAARCAILQQSLLHLAGLQGPHFLPSGTIPKLLHAFLTRGCDPNGFSWSGMTAFDTVRHDPCMWVKWKVTLSSCGYRVCNIINGLDSVTLAVSTDLPVLQGSVEEEAWIDINTNERFLENKLPVTGLTIREWIERRFLLRRRKSIGFASMLPLRAEDLDILRDIDFYTILDCALDKTYDFRCGTPDLEELGVCWYTVLNEYIEADSEEDEDSESDSDYETRSGGTESEEELELDNS